MYRNTGNYKPEASSSLWVQLGTTKLSSAGTSLLKDGLSLNLDQNAGTYSQLMIVFNITGATSKSFTAKINAGTSFKGDTIQVANTTITGANYAGTTIPISQGQASTLAPAILMFIGVGDSTSGNTLMFHWTYAINDARSITGTGYLDTTGSSTFTGIELISSGNMDQYSNVTIYGLKN